jgi:hypothetical protein
MIHDETHTTLLMQMFKEFIRPKSGRNSDSQQVTDRLQTIPQVPVGMNGVVQTLETSSARQNFLLRTRPLRTRLVGARTLTPLQDVESNRQSEPSASDTTISKLEQSLISEAVPIHTHGQPVLNIGNPPEEALALNLTVGNERSNGQWAQPKTSARSEDTGPAIGEETINPTTVPCPTNMAVSTKSATGLSSKPWTPIRLSSDCFIAIHLEMKKARALEFEKRLSPLLREFLRHLSLKDPRISLDCAMAARAEENCAFVPTILFICFTEHQKRTIESGLAKRNLIPPAFVCRVVVQELKLISGSMTMGPGDWAGQVVGGRLPRGCTTLCGLEAQVLFQTGPVDQKTQSFTIGGLVRVGEALYALTTGHSFASGCSVAMRTFHGGCLYILYLLISDNVPDRKQLAQCDSSIKLG